MIGEASPKVQQVATKHCHARRASVAALATVTLGIAGIASAAVAPPLARMARAVIGNLQGKPAWTAPLPDVPWVPAEVASPPDAAALFPLHAWAPNASYAVRLPDGERVLLRSASEARPAAFLVEGLLSPAETAELRKAAVQQLRSAPSTGQNRLHPQIAWLPPSAAPAAKALNRRTAALLRLPERLFSLTNLTVTWYAEGGEYLGHHDAATQEENEARCRSVGRYATPGGLRFATLVWYLTDVEEGGETLFPHQGATEKPPEDQLMTSYSCPAVWGKLTVPAKAGTGVLWYNYLPAPGGGVGGLDWAAFHRGCAVRRGQKLIVTRWVPLPLPADCAARHAAAGSGGRQAAA